jgi:hypothetical protein
MQTYISTTLKIRLSFNGRAEITVKQLKGRSTVGVSAQGIPSAFVAILA